MGAIAVLGAFGIFSAIGGNLVNREFPDVFEFLAGNDSLQISVREVPYDSTEGFSLATGVARQLEAGLGEPDGCEALHAAAKAAGAVNVFQTINNVLVEGNTHRDVTIVDLRPQIVKRGPALAGARAFCQSGGGNETIGLAFDFDEAQPIARNQDGGAYFADGDPITLKQTEIQPFQITATDSEGYVAWNLIADLVVDGDEEAVTIDDDGHPFELTGVAPNSRYDHYFEWLWYEHPSRFYSGPRAYVPKVPAT